MRQGIDLSKDQEGQLYEQIGAIEGRLKWSTINQDIVVRGISESTTLKNIKNAILQLQRTYCSEDAPRVIIEGNQLEDFQKRFLLIENEIEGLMRRRIEYTAVGQQGEGQRFLDYTGLLNQKENQIIELEKKINNLEERLRRASAREIQLENQIVSLNQKLIVKESIIMTKNDVILAEVAATDSMKQTIARLKRNLQMNRSKITPDISNAIMEGVVIPDIGSFDIRGDALIKDGAQGRSQVFSQGSESQKLKTKVVQMFRQFERLFQQGQEVSKDQIERVIEGFLIELQGTRLYESVQVAIRREHIEEQLKRLRQNFAVAGGIYQSSVEQMRIDNPNIRISLQRNLFDILQRENVKAYAAANGAIFVNDFSQRTVEVPVQDARAKHLLHIFACQLKRLFTKYPKLHGEIDERIVEFFQQEVIDCIEVDEIDRLVQIVKYQPQVVKVENVYAYSSQKSRKVEFHLRVLIKALLEQLDKLKNRHGAVLELDEGIMAMIKQEIMGVVDVDDILKVFKVVPKIVEVEKVVEKIVEKLVEVPKTVTIDRVVEKIVEVQKIKEIEKVVNIPLEQPTIVVRQIDKIVPLNNVEQKIVEVPTVRDRIVEVIREVPKIVEVPVNVEKIVEVQSIREVERVVNHVSKQIQQVQVEIEKIVPQETIVEVIKQVPVIVEKIVEVYKQIPKYVEVETVVEKCVPVVEYLNAREVENHIQIQHQIVEKIVQKPIPIHVYIQKIKEVPQIVQKIVEVEIVRTQIREVQVIRQKPVIQEKIKEIVKEVPITIEVIKEIPTEIQKIVEIPIIHEKIRVVQEFIEKPIVQTITKIIAQPVYIREPLVVKEPKIVEVQTIVNHYLQVPQPVKYIEQKIVEVQKKVDRIKEVRVEVDKLVEKMVEVPKVVEVEKVVEKVVVVPRIVEKVIEVPQIVEKVVEKQVIKEVIKEVERIVEKPVYEDKVREVEVQKNVFIEVEKAIDRFVDKLVKETQIREMVEIKQIIQEKIIETRQEYPVQVETEKIVHVFVDNVKLIEIEKPILVPVTIQKPVDMVVEKLVAQPEIREVPVAVPQVIEKIVTVKEYETVVHEIEKLVEKVVIDTKIKEVQKIVPYIKQVIKEVPTIIEKTKIVESEIEKIITAQQIVQKIVEKTIKVPQIYEVQRIKEKVIEVPKLIEIQKVVPQLMRINNYIQRVVQKIVKVPIIVEQLKQVDREYEKVVQVKIESDNIQEIEKNVEKVVVMEKLKEVVREVNYIEKVLEIVDRFEQIPVEIMVKEEVLVEVPYILEKIVEKIVVMPQIVEVLKYVTEVCESDDIGVAVDVDVSVHEQRYKQLSRDIKGHLDLLLREIRSMKQSNPRLKDSIVLIESFLAEFEKYILTPRIVKTVEEKIIEKPVEVEKIVKVPADTERSLRMELTLSLLVEKLILELKRIKQQTGVNFELDEDIKLIFFADLNTRSNLEGELRANFQSYSNRVMRGFQSMGNWSIDHQLMLNSFLQQRFMMAEIVHEANIRIEQAQRISEQRLEALRRYKKDRHEFEQMLISLGSELRNQGQLMQNLGGAFDIINRFNNYNNNQITEPVHRLIDISLDERIQSLFREKDEQICQLRQIITKFGKRGGEDLENQIKRLRLENTELKMRITEINCSLNIEEIQKHIIPIKDQLDEYKDRNIALQSENSELYSEFYNLEAENKVLRELFGPDVSSRLSEHQITHQSPQRRDKYRGPHVLRQSRDLMTEGRELSGSKIDVYVNGSPDRNEKNFRYTDSTAFKDGSGGIYRQDMNTPNRDYREMGGDKRWQSNKGEYASTTPIKQLTDKSGGNTAQQLPQQNLGESRQQMGQGQRARIQINKETTITKTTKISQPGEPKITGGYYAQQGVEGQQGGQLGATTRYLGQQGATRYTGQDLAGSQASQKAQDKPQQIPQGQYTQQQYQPGQYQQYQAQGQGQVRGQQGQIYQLGRQTASQYQPYQTGQQGLQQQYQGQGQQGVGQRDLTGSKTSTDARVLGASQASQRGYQGYKPTQQQDPPKKE